MAIEYSKMTEKRFRVDFGVFYEKGFEGYFIVSREESRYIHLFETTSYLGDITLINSYDQNKAHDREALIHILQELGIGEEIR